MVWTLIWKSVLVVVVAELAVVGLRRHSAALRHLAWLSAVLVLLGLPLVVGVLPEWRPRVAAPVRVGQVARTVITVTEGAGKEVDWGKWLWSGWGLGAVVVLLRAGVGQYLAWNVARRARPWRRHAGIEVRLTGETRMPFVCGLRQVVAVLPEEAREWPEERLESVLRHECGHALRRDPLAQFLAEAACGLYWPLPWVWRAAARLRLEAEIACDDEVLREGARPSEYAGHLMEVVRGLAEGERWVERGVPMARMSDLETRVRAMLAVGKRRAPVGVKARWAAAVLSLAVLVPLGALRSPLYGYDGGISGTVKDASGAVVPGSRVMLVFEGSDRREVKFTKEEGSFQFAAVPDGRYELQVSKPGFAMTKVGLFEVAGGPKTLEVVLNMGTIRETVSVKGDAPAAAVMPKPAPGPAAAAPTRIRVGGNVQAAKMVYQSRPTYPPSCKADRVEGTVLFKAVIGKDGTILSLEQINQQVDERLVTSAREAVQLWRYEPTLLNGQPVEIITEIEVNYTLMP